MQIRFIFLFVCWFIYETATCSCCCCWLFFCFCSYMYGFGFLFLLLLACVMFTLFLHCMCMLVGRLFHLMRWQTLNRLGMASADSFWYFSFSRTEFMWCTWIRAPFISFSHRSSMRYEFVFDSQNFDWQQYVTTTLFVSATKIRTTKRIISSHLHSKYESFTWQIDCSLSYHCAHIFWWLKAWSLTLNAKIQILPFGASLMHSQIV